MIQIPDWMFSEHWHHIVWALLHTLWTGGLFALVLYGVLRRYTSPFVRYRACLVSFAAVLLSGLVAWAILDRAPEPGQLSRPTKSPQSTIVPGAGKNAMAPLPSSASARTTISDSSPDFALRATPPQGLLHQLVPWLGLFWLSGMICMLFRAGRLVRA